MTLRRTATLISFFFAIALTGCAPSGLPIHPTSTIAQ